MARRRELKRAERRIKRATSYAQWLPIAEEIDRLTGAERWRMDPSSSLFHSELLVAHTRKMRRLREDRAAPGLLRFMQESLHRNLGDISSPELYNRALCGTKRVIESFIEETVLAIEFLTEAEGTGRVQTVELVRRADRVFGRSALVLSGGASLGFHHLGVVKALLEVDLLPSVISGASMGAMVAAGACGRTDDEIHGYFESPERLERFGLQLGSLKEIWRNRALLRPERLLRAIEQNAGEHTFAEAYERSGRVLNITLTPVRKRQTARLLCHLSAPEVLISSAALASSAVPGLFPAIELQARDADGQRRPYIAGERWIDGSFGQDVPMLELARLHNVNHFIVSQTNPHVWPVGAAKQRPGLFSYVVNVSSSALKEQSRSTLSLVRRLAEPTPLSVWTDVLHSLAEQRYSGDIDIVPRFDPLMYRKLLSNPSRKDILYFVREGQRATWPQIPMIKDHTRISRAFERCLREVGS